MILCHKLVIGQPTDRRTPPAECLEFRLATFLVVPWPAVGDFVRELVAGHCSPKTRLQLGILERMGWWSAFRGRGPDSSPADAREMSADAMEEGRADVGAAVAHGGPACSNSRAAPASPRSTTQVTRSAAAPCPSWCPGNPGPCLYKASPPGQPNLSFYAVKTSVLRQRAFRPVLQSQSGGCRGVFCCCAVAPASPSAKVLEVRKLFSSTA